MVMRKLIFILSLVFQLIGCISIKNQNTKTQDVSGLYNRQKSTERLELKIDGTYMLLKPEISFTPVVEQCDYASKGKWSLVADNVLEITSENYFLKQKGFDYELKKENKFSQDSLYFTVVFPVDFQSVNLGLTFNNSNSKSLVTDKTTIVLAKSKYLWDRRTSDNFISFGVTADVAGTILYKSRVLFKIFEEYIDTEKHNYLTITLPNFDRCFFEFEPYCQELIYIKGENELLWQGDIWKK